MVIISTKVRLRVAQCFDTFSGADFRPRASQIHRFLSTLFSSSYKTLFQQPPCFHIYTKRPGVVGSSTGTPACAPTKRTQERSTISDGPHVIQRALVYFRRANAPRQPA